MHHDIQKFIFYHNFYLIFPICRRKEFKLFQLLESFKKNVLMHRQSIKKSLYYVIHGKIQGQWALKKPNYFTMSDIQSCIAHSYIDGLCWTCWNTGSLFGTWHFMHIFCCWPFPMGCLNGKQNSNSYCSSKANNRSDKKMSASSQKKFG